MRKQTLAAIIPLMGIVLIAGCVGETGQGTTTQPTGGDGLAITDFSASPSDLRSGMQSSISMTIENQGDATVLSNTSLVLLQIPTDWNLDKGINQNFSRNIQPADTATGRPADSQTFRWSATAPTLPRGQSFTYTVTGRVYFDYVTVARGIVPVYPLGESQTQGASFSSSKGPIQLDGSVSPNPPVIEDAGDTFTLNVVITNAGGGSAYRTGVVYKDSYTISDSQRDKVNISVVLPFGLNLTDPDCVTDVELFGDRAMIQCDVTVKNKPAAAQPYQVAAVASYGYYKETPISITVSGK